MLPTPKSVHGLDPQRWGADSSKNHREQGQYVVGLLIQIRKQIRSTRYRGNR